MTRSRWVTIGFLALGAGLFFALNLERFFTFERLKSDQNVLRELARSNPLEVVVGFFLIYTLMAAFPFVPHIPLSLAAGAIFGLGRGTLLASFASSIGATMAFLLARHLFRDPVERRFGNRLASFQEGFRENGATFLFSLRLIPLVPFFLVNIVMGLTHLPTRTFYLTSQIGMFPATLIIVNAGTRLGSITRPSGFLSPGVLTSFVVLGVFPWIARGIVRFVRIRNTSRKWPRPSRFDRNMVVIGAGSAGLVTAYIAAAVKAKVTLIESGNMGGDCLNTGCVPSKALIRSAKFVAQIRKAASLGVARADISVDFADIMSRVRRVISRVAPHDSVERYKELGVEVIKGQARIVSPWAVEVNGVTLTTRSIVIAAGAHPRIPDLPGLDTVCWYTSDTIWSIGELPRRLVILGGGPIGCELGQAFARLGSSVTLVERGNRLLKKEDSDVSSVIEEIFTEEGIEILTGHLSVRCERVGDENRLVVRQGEKERTLVFDALLLSLGRVARTEGYGLEDLGISLSKDRTIDTNAWLATNYPNIYACGDVAGPYQFTHTAGHQAWYAAVNALFGGVKRFRVDYSVIPWCTFTDPEVARVGINEQEAMEKGIGYEVTRFDFQELDRAITEDAETGFVKVLTPPGKDRILGVTIVGDHAGELLAEFVLAMKHGLGLNKILSTIHVYPTWSEANKYVAGVWKRAHAPQSLLEWIRRYHNWRRGNGGAPMC